MAFSTNATRIVPLPSSGDVLTDVLRQGTGRLLSQAIAAEVSDWLERRKEHYDDVGQCWVAAIDWHAIRHALEEPRIEKGDVAR